MATGDSQSSEINGEEVVDAETGESTPTSSELNDLLGFLPDSWTYTLASSGGSLRVAFLYDTAVVEVREVIEWDVPRRLIEGKDIFARDPIAALVSFLQNGQRMNDLIVVGLHLASGQDNDDNHDEAMATLRQLLTEKQAQGALGGTAERDMLLMGDLNANMFRPPVEQFFLDMDVTADTPDSLWDVLAGDDYPATRLSGNPLQLRTSEIDYIIATTTNASATGLVGEEISAQTATVHTELLDSRTPVQFRRDLSDHLPLTVGVSTTASAKARAKPVCLFFRSFCRFSVDTPRPSC